MDKPIISVTLKPWRANAAVCVSRSCWGSGTVSGPPVTASMRPARNGMLGPPQFFIARMTLGQVRSTTELTMKVNNTPKPSHLTLSIFNVSPSFCESPQRLLTRRSLGLECAEKNQRCVHRGAYILRTACFEADRRVKAPETGFSVVRRHIVVRAKNAKINTSIKL